MAKRNNDYKIHVISNTHWDREWRFSFEETRLRLVEVLDKLLDLFDSDPDFKHYHFDSQTIGIEDYLEVRPENTERVRKAVRSGKLLVGPWYGLPDEFMVSGESLVRNLVIGHQVAESLGKVMKVGYNPFSFCGQNSQIAQIYNGFDIDTIIFYRGIGSEGNGKDFYLEASDGSRVLNIRLTQRTRFNFLYLVGRAMYFGRMPAVRNHYEVEEGGRICRFAEDALEARDFEMITEPYVWREDLLAQRFAELVEEMKQPATTRHLIAMDGYDSSAPSQFTTKIIKLAKEELGYDIVHDSLPNLVAMIKTEAPKNLPVARKEMCFKRSTPIGTLSARYHIKQQNRAAEFALARTAEPLCTLAMTHSSFEYPALSLRGAWKALLANQCHDSIGGCASDKVHRAMTERFAKAIEVSRAQSKRASMSIASHIDCSRMPTNHIAVCVFNSLSESRDELIDAYIMVPKEVELTNPTLHDADGKAIDAIIRQDEDWTANVEKFAMDVHSLANCQTWRIQFRADALPALGWRTLHLRSNPARVRKMEPAKKAAKADVLENDHLKVRIRPNGTLDVTHKASGRKHTGLHWFEDRGECGGPWHSGLVPGDKPLDTKKCQAKISVVEENPFVSVREIALKFRLPADVTPDESSRTKKTVDLPIRTKVILKKHSRMLEFETWVDNIARSHRLRAMFPTGLTGATDSVVEGQFDVVSRPIIPLDPEDAQLPGGDFIEPTIHAPVSGRPQLSFMDISDGAAGFALINAGMCELEVIDDKPRTVGLTLLRTFPKLKIMHAWMEGSEGQCMGPGTFRYALMPHEGDWTKADLHDHAHRFNTPPLVLQFLTDGQAGPLPPTYSLLQTQGAVVDCIKKAERSDNLILRIHNPRSRKRKFTVKCARPITRAWQCNLNEERRGKLKPDGNRLTGTIEPKKIMTIEMTLGK